MYRIQFVKTGSDADSLASDVIAIWPTANGFNDFGRMFRGRCQIKGQAANGSVANLELDLRIAERTETLDSIFKTFFEGKFSKLPKNWDKTICQLRYYSILERESEYQRLVNWVTSLESVEALEDRLHKILSTLNDLCFLRYFRPEKDVDEFLDSPRVRESMFRSTETLHALDVGWRTIRFCRRRLIDDSRIGFSFRVHLPGFSGLHELKMVFSAPDFLNDRCHALIGVNGTGKTSFMNALITFLAHPKKKGLKTVLKKVKSQSKLQNNDSRLTFSRLIAISSDVKTIFPTSFSKESDLDYIFYNSFEVEGSSEATTNDSLTDKLCELLFYSNSDDSKIVLESIEKVVKLNQLRFVVKTDSPDKREDISIDSIRGKGELHSLQQLSRIDRSHAPRFRDDDDQIFELSSGQRTFIEFAIKLNTRLKHGSLVLLDEPEVHLHPNLISQFMGLLLHMLESMKSIALIATHSPFVVRELPSSCVHVVKVNSEKVPSISSAFLRSFGATVSRLSNDIFDDASSSQVNLEFAKKVAKLQLSWDQIEKTYANEISVETLSHIFRLRGDDDFIKIESDESE